MSRTFTVGVTRDLEPTTGATTLDALGLRTLGVEPGVLWDFVGSLAGELTPDSIRACNAVILLGPTVTARTLSQAERLCLIARWGVGTNNIDIDACTDAGVIVTITPEAVRRPVASGAMAFILALAHRVVDKDRAARAGGWGKRLDTLGTGLAGRVLGVVGLGNVGRELLALARPFDMRRLAADPYVSPRAVQDAGATPVDLDELLGAADVVCLTCALTPETYHLIDTPRLARMRPEAVLVNVARGGLVDQTALVHALRMNTIRAAALDTLDPEPPADDDPILGLDNVLLAPHSIAWTTQLAHGNTTACCRAILDLLAGKAPRHLVNPAVLASPLLRDKLVHNAIIRASSDPEVTP